MSTHILFIIFLIFVKNYKCDIMLNHFKTEFGDWKQNIPKVWNGYIRMYFYRCLGNKTYFYKDKMRNVLMQTFCNSKALGRQKILETCQAISTRRCLVKRPIQHINLSNRNSAHHYTYGYMTQNLAFMYWNLNPKLRLNITFFSIDLSHSEWNCEPVTSMSGLIIIDGILPERCQSRNITLQHIFCGQYSTFNFYPIHRKVIMCTKIAVFGTEYQVAGMSMIMDRCQLNNVVSTLHEIVRPELVYKIREKYTVFRFFISVKKLNKIVIKIIKSKMHRYVVSDGPVLLTDTMDISGDVATTSSFQCLVFLSTLNGKTVQKDSFTFTSKPLSIHSNIYINQTGNSVFNFPNRKCKKGLCIFSVNANLGYQINVTSIEVKSTVPHNLHCLYAGLVTGENLLSDYKETNTICKSNVKHVNNFYSINSSLIIFLYWYEGCSKIIASLKISQTKCKLVPINLCYLQNICLRNEAQCHSYLRNVTKFSGIDLKFHKFEILAYNGSKEECGILQFSNTELHKIVGRRMSYLSLMLSNYAKDHLFCYIILTPKHSVNIQARFFAVNKEDLCITERKIDFCQSSHSCFNKLYEPKIPRMIQKYKNMSSTINILKDTSLELKIKEIVTNSWIELIIESSARNSTYQFPFDNNLRIFAVDFILNDRRSLAFANLPLLNTTNVLLLKSNIKTVDPNIYLILQSIIWGQSMQLDWKSKFLLHQLNYKKYISLPRNFFLLSVYFEPNTDIIDVGTGVSSTFPLHQLKHRKIHLSNVGIHKNETLTV